MIQSRKAIFKSMGMVAVHVFTLMIQSRKAIFKSMGMVAVHV